VWGFGRMLSRGRLSVGGLKAGLPAVAAVPMVLLIVVSIASIATAPRTVPNKFADCAEMLQPSEK